MAIRTIGFYRPDPRAVALACRNMHGKWLTNPDPFGLVRWRFNRVSSIGTAANVPLRQASLSVGLPILASDNVLLTSTSIVIVGGLHC